MITTGNGSALNAVYGAFGGIMALLLWIYVSECIFIFGACLCSGQAEMRSLPVKTSIARAGTKWWNREQHNAVGASVVSNADSRVAVRVIHTDEEWMIANLVRHVLGLTIEKEYGS